MERVRVCERSGEYGSVSREAEGGGRTRDETKRMDARDARDARNESDRCTYGSRQAEGILTWT